MATYEEKLGKILIRVVASAEGGFAGRTIRGTTMGEIIHDDDRECLIARLRNEAGKLEPSYHGMDAAIARFLEFMPGGFSGERIQKERPYKVKASLAFKAVLSPEQAMGATRADADAVRKAPVWINLLSPFESMRLKDVIEGPHGPAFLQAAAKFAAGDLGAGLAGMRAATKNHGALTWPMATYFPFLWDPAAQMFLKPAVTCDFAERIGHSFQYQYDSELKPEVYAGLLALADHTRVALAELKPVDNIDLQSFIWVVGGYTDADLPPEPA